MYNNQASKAVQVMTSVSKAFPNQAVKPVLSLHGTEFDGAYSASMTDGQTHYTNYGIALKSDNKEQFVTYIQGLESADAEIIAKIKDAHDKDGEVKISFFVEEVVGNGKFTKDTNASMTVSGKFNYANGQASVISAELPTFKGVDATIG